MPRKQGSSTRISDTHLSLPVQVSTVVLVVTGVTVVPPGVSASTGSCGCFCGEDVWWEMVLLPDHWGVMFGRQECSKV